MSATRIFLFRIVLLAGAIAFPTRAFAFCHELEVVQSGIRRVAAAAPQITVEWMGHSTFQITSSKGTRILTDPHGAFDLPRPTLPQHIVTTSHQHGPHNSVHMAPGTPAILHGLTPAGNDWQKISTTIRDVSVYAVPAFHDKSQGMQRGKNAVFVFRVDDICIAHLGDLGHLLTPAQLKMMGKIDILLVPIAGGYFTVTATEAKEVTRQVNPKCDSHAFLVGAGRAGIRSRRGQSKNLEHAGAENVQSGTAHADGSRDFALGAAQLNNSRPWAEELQGCRTRLSLPSFRRKPESRRLLELQRSEPGCRPTAGMTKLRFASKARGTSTISEGDISQ